MNNKTPTTAKEFLELFKKQAFVPSQNKSAGAAMPPPPPGGATMPPLPGGAPMPPMDPSMAGGMPPMDPSMGGAMPPQGGDPIQDLMPMLEEFGSALQRQEQELTATKQEIGELRNALMDLSSKYSQISGQYSTIIQIMQGGKLPEAPKLM